MFTRNSNYYEGYELKIGAVCFYPKLLLWNRKGKFRCHTGYNNNNKLLSNHHGQTESNRRVEIFN